MSKPITVGVALVLTAFAVSAAVSSKIKSITSKNVGEGFEIAIKGDSLQKPHTFFYRDGRSFVVDFNAKLTISQSRKKVSRSGVDYFNFAQYRPETARLHIQVKKGVKPTIVEEDGTWYVRVGVAAKSPSSSDKGTDLPQPEKAGPSGKYPVKVSEDEIAMAKAIAELKGEEFDRDKFIAATEKIRKATELPQPQKANPGGKKYPVQVSKDETAKARAIDKLDGEKSGKADDLPHPGKTGSIGDKYPVKVTEDQIVMAEAIAKLKGEEFNRAEYIALATAAMEAANKGSSLPQPQKIGAIKDKYPIKVANGKNGKTKTLPIPIKVNKDGAASGTPTTPVKDHIQPDQVKSVIGKYERFDEISGKMVAHDVTTGMLVDATTKSGYTEDQPGMIAPTPTVPAIASPFQDVRVTINADLLDVRLVLQVLSKQAGVNVISSPNVSPKDKPVFMSFELNDVSLDFAMNSITALNSLRYARISNTFVVTTADEFHDVMRDLVVRNDDYQTRIIQISSGEAAQIRDAALMAIPQDGPGGYYELIDPTSSDYGTNLPATTGAGSQSGSEVGSMGGAGAALGAALGTAGTGPGLQNPLIPSGQAAPKKQRARYIMIVGESKRLDSIEAYILDVDARISESFSLRGVAEVDTVVVPIYSGQTANIKATLAKLIQDNPRAMDYSIEESSVKELTEGEESTKVVIIAGPRLEIPTLEQFATSMDVTLCSIGDIYRPDGPDGYKKFYEVVDLMFIEPTLAEFDLKNRVRGLYVTILPDPVTPGIEGELDAAKQDKPADDGTAPATGSGTDELTKAIGHEQMRLVLRGTRTQIDKAKDYLMAVDIPARQVAIELRIMELTKEEALKVGLDWSILNATGVVNLRVNQSITGTSATAGNVTASGSDIFGSNRSASVLSTLDQLSNDRNLIARPNALITDGRGTRLFVGDTVRYVKSIVSSQNGTSVEIDEIDVGVTVDVKARIGADGNIAFTLDQNFSILTGFTAVPGGGSIPQTSDRETTMFVNMKSGETVALGGLILDQLRKKVQGIPILKDIPILGPLLFSRTDNSKVRTELVFFMTAIEVNKDNRQDAASPRNSLEKTPDPQGDYLKNKKGGGN